jgi:ATP-dependent RNA helicase SUPV3L1/SUV3
LPDASRETIDTRIGLWIAATTRRVLAPLFALDGMQEGSEIVRDLAREVVRSLGVLEREPIRAKIKALSQDDRAELRKLGVRFGAYYVFVPALIKPAPRTLALQLWGLQAPGDANELLRTLGPVASSGRTSLPLDKGISREGYRVAGYRLCGERVVRVDVVERLAGIIRGALGGEPPGRAPGGPRHRSSKGFVVTGEMTSLTGCSGEQFGSILRSMGFRSVEMKRTDYFGSSPSPDESRGQEEPDASAADQGPMAHDQPPPGETSEERATDAILVAPPAEPPPNAVPEGADAVPEDTDPVPEDADAVPEDADAVSKGADVVPADMAASSSDPSDGALAADANAQAESAQTAGTSCESAKSADMILVWRPDHRRSSPNRGGERKHSRGATPGRLDSESHTADEPPRRTREAVARTPTTPNRSDQTRADKKRRQRISGYDMPKSAPATAPQHGAKVDPNSPFAKLLELRSLLEEQANKRS